jgi:hypothetical protein
MVDVTVRNRVPEERTFFSTGDWFLEGSGLYLVTNEETATCLYTGVVECIDNFEPSKVTFLDKVEIVLN